MEAIRRVGFLSFVLVIGIFSGASGLRLVFMIVMLLSIPWFMSWDEKRHTRTRKQQQTRYVHRKFP